MSRHGPAAGRIMYRYCVRWKRPLRRSLRWPTGFLVLTTAIDDQLGTYLAVQDSCLRVVA